MEIHCDFMKSSIVSKGCKQANLQMEVGSAKPKYRSFVQTDLMTKVSAFYRQIFGNKLKFWFSKDLAVKRRKYLYWNLKNQKSL